jgi:hypothetical protein
MKRDISKILILIQIIFIFKSKMLSCTCIGESNVENELEVRDMVFYGKVISQREIKFSELLEEPMPMDTSYTIYEYTFLVKRKYKGDYFTDTIKVYSGNGNGDCGIIFTVQKEYIVYSEKRNYPNLNSEKIRNVLFTDICTRTCEYNKKEERKIKRALKKIRKKKL